MLASPEFDCSCRDFESYPSNLIQKTLNIYSAKSCQTTIAQSVPRLLVTNEAHTQVWFRDFHIHNGAVQSEEKQLRHGSEIVQWLGDSTEDPSLGTLPAGQVATKRDPQCRIIYLTAPNNRSALRITKRSLTRILTFHQVMPAYLNIVSSLFGYSEGPVNPTYFALQDRVFLDSADPGHRMPLLGRSGRHLQLAYVLKKISSPSDPNQAVENQEWSIRPAAFYHHFEIESGAAFWLTTHGRPDLYERIKETTKWADERTVASAVHDNFRCTLQMHLTHASWASEGWSHHIKWFEGKIENETHLNVHGPSDDVFDNSSCNTEQLNRIQILEEKLNEAINVLEGNIKIVQALRSFYLGLTKTEKFWDQVARRNDHMIFDKELGQIESDLGTVLARAKYQSKRAGDRKNLVLLQLQDRNLLKTEAIALDTRKVSIESGHEAVVMRIFTAVTLVYLPATFAAAIFSTDIIKYQNGGTFESEALQRWLEVALPLTVVTLLIAGGFFYKSYRDSQIRKNFVPLTEIYKLYRGSRILSKAAEKG